MGNKPGCGGCASYAAVPADEGEGDEGDVSERPPDVKQRQWEDHISSCRALSRVLAKANGTCDIERASIYGAAVAMPQFARTSGWSVQFTALAVRSYVFLFTNYLLQLFMLYMIMKEERVNDKFEGQMHLCNMGASTGSEYCPDYADCQGPGGTTYTAERIYKWETWRTRRFIKESFMNIFPDRAADVENSIDIGEYGLESFWLRITCHGLFVMGLMPDLTGTYMLMQLIRKVATKKEPWIRPTDEDATDVRFVLAGMPLKWKVTNVLMVLLPKMYIWLLMVDTGTTFLMETAEIEDMIVNAIALSFILEVDEMIFQALFSDTAKDILEELEPLSMYEYVDDGQVRSVWDKHQENRDWNFLSPIFYQMVFPVRLVGIIIVVAFFQWKYYQEHCILRQDGSMVPKNLHLPTTDNLDIMSFIWGPIPSFFPVLTVEETEWSMPPIPGF